MLIKYNFHFTKATKQLDGRYKHVSSFYNLALWSQEVLRKSPFPLVWNLYRNQELEATLLIIIGHNSFTLEMRKMRLKIGKIIFPK